MINFVDLEVFPNLVTLQFLSETGDKKVFYMDENKTKLNNDDIMQIHKIMYYSTTVGFNTFEFDNLLICAALQGLELGYIVHLTREIITNGKRTFQILQENKNLKRLHLEGCNCIDLINLLPLKASLKQYGARINCETIQDLPYSPTKILSDSEKKDVIDYCFNDLNVTKLIYDYVSPSIKLREELGRHYGGIDLRSKSDAQIAETVISKLYKDKFFRYPNVPKLKNHSWKYIPPSYLKFKNKKLQDILDKISASILYLNDKQEVTMDVTIKNLNIYNNSFNIKLGGLHSNEKSIHVQSDEKYKIINADVTSYYPSMILLNKWYPYQLTDWFLDIFKEFVDKRIEGKKNNIAIYKDGLKIVINGIFGKFGSKYSVVFAPELLTNVTLTGQFTLLLLIERLHTVGIQNISANTDGIVSKVPTDKIDLFYEIIKEWENDTGLQMECDNWKALYARDVNNYIAIDESLKIKAKGCGISKFDLSHNPAGFISKIAVKEFILNKTPIEKTIKECTDLSLFCFVTKVTGSAIFKKQDVGKTVRYYYCTEKFNSIYYKQNGNRVPNSIGAMVINKLPTEFPSDIDYDVYIENAISLLHDIAYYETRHSPSFIFNE